MPASQALAAPTLDCYRVEPDAPPIVAAASRRAWMDETHQRFAYRCTPMAIANASGWELRCPFAFEAVWDGSTAIEAITVMTRAAGGQVERLLASHFGHGVLTFHVGWLFRTPPGWALWARGAPNHLKDGIGALDGLVETDWLPFTFTMNWRFTRPGRIAFAKDEPFCFMTLSPHGALDAVQPVLREIGEDPALAAEHDRWRASRDAFNVGLRTNDPTAVRAGWQRTYIRGQGGDDTPAFHVTKRRLKDPQAAGR